MHEGCRETFGKRKNTRAAARVFLRFPKVEQYPKCMDHAILLGKPFGNWQFQILVYACRGRWEVRYHIGDYAEKTKMVAV
jgi:hypothetical protein